MPSKPLPIPTIEFTDSGVPSLHWEDHDGRYHVWLDPETHKPTTGLFSSSSGPIVIYKNPLVEMRQPGYFNTRYLSYSVIKNKALVDALLDKLDIPAEHEAWLEYQRQKELDAEKARIEEQRQERIREAAPDLLAALELTEALDNRHDCPECGGEMQPEACPECFPKADQARLARRAAIAKTEVPSQ